MSSKDNNYQQLGTLMLVKLLEEILRGESPSAECVHFYQLKGPQIIEILKNTPRDGKAILRALDLTPPPHRPSSSNSEKTARALYHVDLVTKKLKELEQDKPTNDIFEEVSLDIIDAVAPGSSDATTIPGHSSRQIKRDWLEYKDGKFDDEYIA